jgi:SAM-dependent methyltransferase
MSNYSLIAKHYDALYADKDYRSEVFFLKKLIDRYTALVEAPSILDVGCGTGSHIFEMYSIFDSCSILGVEPCLEMFNIAAKKLGDVTDIEILNKDLSGVVELDESFDVVTSLFHVVNQIGSLKTLRRFFNDVGEVLSGDGIFLFDSWNDVAVHLSPPVLKERKLFDFSFRCQPTVDFANSLVTLCNSLSFYTGEKEEYALPITLWPGKVYGDLCEDAGLEIIGTYAGFTDKRASVDSYKILYAARRR